MERIFVRVKPDNGSMFSGMKGEVVDTDRNGWVSVDFYNLGVEVAFEDSELVFINTEQEENMNNFKQGEKVLCTHDDFLGDVGIIVQSLNTHLSIFDVDMRETVGGVFQINKDHLVRVSENYYQQKVAEYNMEDEPSYTVEDFEKEIRSAISKIGQKGWRVDGILVDNWCDATTIDGKGHAPVSIRFDMTK